MGHPAEVFASERPKTREVVSTAWDAPKRMVEVGSTHESEDHAMRYMHFTPGRLVTGTLLCASLVAVAAVGSASLFGVHVAAADGLPLVPNSALPPPPVPSPTPTPKPTLPIAPLPTKKSACVTRSTATRPAPR